MTKKLKKESNVKKKKKNNSKKGKEKVPEISTKEKREKETHMFALRLNQEKTYFKGFTSKKMLQTIEENNQESRREWMLWMMERAGSKNSNVKNRQFWQQHNKPIELWSNEVIDLKVDYIHNNPVVSGFVCEPAHWKYSSARNYAGEKGILEIDFE